MRETEYSAFMYSLKKAVSDSYGVVADRYLIDPTKIIIWNADRWDTSFIELGIRVTADMSCEEFFEYSNGTYMD